VLQHLKLSLGLNNINSKIKFMKLILNLKSLKSEKTAERLFSGLLKKSRVEKWQKQVSGRIRSRIRKGYDILASVQSS